MRPDPLAPDPADPLARLADQRQRLQQLTTSLAASLDPQAVAERILEMACTQLGAPQGWVAAVDDDGGVARILAARGYP
ncbi:MAG TPA: hypothetical protein ENO14_00685, partial [Chromatiales bacterium]|nr:hypothetical protein [Chromatiales bacterium]